MDEINSILENLMKIPVYELTTGMFIQIQELKDLASKYNDDPSIYDTFMEKYKNLNLDKGVKKQDNITISTLYKKIQTLEKINSELQAKMSAISFDNIYLQNDTLKPTYGNILVYTPKQTEFWVIPSSMLDYPIVSTFTTSNQIAGWYFSSKGWQALLLTDNKLHISVKVEDNKKLQSNNTFYLLETSLWKVLIQKNNNIIPIYSSLISSHAFLGDFSNIHRFNVFLTESKTFYIEKLQHTLVTLLQWNYSFNDAIILNELMNNNWNILTTLKAEELLQPLHSASVIIYPHEEDLVNWQILLSLLRAYSFKTSLHLPKLSLFTKTTKYQLLNYYSSILQDNEEFQKVVSDNTIFEEQYLLFSNIIDNNNTLTEIKNLLQIIPCREQPRKLDFWFEVIKLLLADNFNYLKYYINLQINKKIETDNIYNTIQDSILKIRNKCVVDGNALIPLPLTANNTQYDIWRNVIVKNFAPAYAKKLEIIFDYLIKGDLKGIFSFFKNQRLIDVIDNIVLCLYDTMDWGLLINQINHLILFLNIPTQTSFYEGLVDIIMNKDTDKLTLNKFVAQFTSNDNVKDLIMSLDFNSLCGFGVHQILTKKGILCPLDLTLNNNGLYWDDTGLYLTVNDLTINKLVSTKVDITNTGMVCGYVSFTYNNTTFNSTSNIYISNTNDFTRVPPEFHYIYCIAKRAIYFDTIVYNRLLENSTKYLKILGLCVLDSFTKKYKIDISCFEQDHDICIEENLILYTIDGLPFKYNNQTDLSYIINLQTEIYHRRK